ncbi:MAG: DNA-binding protein WhiA [Chloroflexi bacterium GWC2_73_18]|nr:MAG: DNA-binding protein WhiA [Chloroflexi bacterium GWC2_73_18]
MSAAAERDLVVAIRAEMAGIAPSRGCCRRAEAAALAPFAREASLARLAVRLGGDPDRHEPYWSWTTAAPHCRAAYLRGLFLTRGSLSLAGGRTHLEFVLEPDRAKRLTGQLAELGLPASQRARRGRGVVTWKSAETIATFLRLAGASASLLQLEAQRVARTLRGELNRSLNAEAANLARAVQAAARQIEAIDRLEAEGLLPSLPPRARSVAAARREAPEATLAELATALGLHRSAVQRQLERLEWRSLSGETAGRPGPGRAAPI